MKKFRKICCTLLTVGMLTQGLAMSAFAAEGTWKKSSYGWWYSYSDGSYAANEWVKDGGKWYYFDDFGYMFTGWISEKGKWYYLGKNGAMATGWVKDGGEWYYLGKNGAMVTGWKKITGSWYYFDKNGAMVTGWQVIDDLQYYFTEDGEMVTGDYVIEGLTAHFGDDGVLIPEVVPGPFLPGGWTEPEAQPLTEAQQAIFDRAAATYAGGSFEAMAFLGSQVVEGTNYGFLCKETLTVLDPITYYVIVTVYVTPEGNAMISNVLSCGIDAPEAGLDGSYVEPVSIFLSSDDIVIDNALKAFDSAMEGFAGVEYEPLAVLGEQVVAGMNYHILCYAKVADVDADEFFAVVTVYQPLEGSAEVSEVSAFED